MTASLSPVVLDPARVPLLGPATATMAQARELARSSGAARMEELERFIGELWRLGDEAGYDPAVVFAQFCLETASGASVVTLEDEDGLVNVVVWRDLAERQRRVLLESRLLVVEGRLESAEGVQHLIAARLDDFSELLGSLATRSRDFR